LTSPKKKKEKPDFWKKLFDLNDQILEIINDSQKWERLSGLLITRGQLMQTMVDLIRIGHLKPATEKQQSQLHAYQEGMIKKVQRLQNQMHNSKKITDKYEASF